MIKANVKLECWNAGKYITTNKSDSFYIPEANSGPSIGSSAAGKSSAGSQVSTELLWHRNRMFEFLNWMEFPLKPHNSDA